MNRNEEEIDEIIDEAEDNLFDHQDKILDEIEDNLFGDQCEPNLSIDEVDFKAKAEFIGDRLEKEFQKGELKAIEEADLTNFDIYLYALVSAENFQQFDLLIKFLQSNFDISEEEALNYQLSFLNVINLYRKLKDYLEYKNPDNSINFDDMAEGIGKKMLIPTFISLGNFCVRGRVIKQDSEGNVYITEVQNLKLEVIKHIIERIAEWEIQEK